MRRSKGRWAVKTDSSLPPTDAGAVGFVEIFGLDVFPVIDTLRIAPSPLGDSNPAPDPLPARETANERLVHTTLR